MAVIKNEELYKLNNSLASVDPSSLSTLGQANEDTLGILSSRITGVLDGSSDDNWNDSVKTGLNDSISKIKEIIEKAKKSSNFISQGAGPVESLKTVCANYVTQYDAYETELKKNISQYEKDDEGEDIVTESGNKIVSQDYIDWETKIEAYEASLPKLEEEVLRIKKEVKNYFAAVNFETNTIDSSIYTEGAANIKFNFGDYFNGKVQVTKEEYVTKHKDTKIDPETGKVVTVEEYEVHREFVDGASLDGTGTKETEFEDENNNQELDEGEQFVETVNESGIITDADGKQHDYEHSATTDNDGVVESETTVTDHETKEQEYHQETDRKAAYDDQVGARTTETTQVEETKEEVTTTRTVSKNNDDGEKFNSDVTVTQKQADRECGTVVTEDGRKITVYRDEDGNLRAKETHTDKNGVEQEYTDKEIPSETKTFSIKHPDGTVETMEVNPNNPIDQQLMRNKMEDARSQYYVDSNDAGLEYQELMNDGSSSISDAWSADQYTFTLE